MIVLGPVRRHQWDERGHASFGIGTLEHDPENGNRFPAFAKPASAGEARSEKIMLQQTHLDHDLIKLDRIMV